MPCAPLNSQSHTGHRSCLPGGAGSARAISSRSPAFFFFFWRVGVSLRGAEARRALPRALERLAAGAAATFGRRRARDRAFRDAAIRDRRLRRPGTPEPPSLRVSSTLRLPGRFLFFFFRRLRSPRDFFPGRQPRVRPGARGGGRGGHGPRAAVRAVEPPVVPRADVQDVPVPEHVRGRDGVPVEPERHRGRVARQAEVCDDRVRERSARSRARTSRGAVPHAEVLRRAPFDRHQTRVDVEAQTRRVSEIRLVSQIRRKVGRRRGCRRGHRMRPVPMTFHVRVPEAEKTPPRSHAPDAARPHSPRALRGRCGTPIPAHRRKRRDAKKPKEAKKK